MKKFNYLFLSALMTLCMVSFISCSNDDDDDDGHNNGNQLAKDIVGKWTLESSVLDLNCEPKEATDPIKGFYTDEKGAYAYNFSADGKYVVIYTSTGTEDDRGTYTVKGDRVELISSGVSPRASKMKSNPNTKVLTNVKVSGGQLSMQADLASSLKENAESDKFWEEIKVEKPEIFVVEKFTGVYTFNVTKEPK